MRKGTEMGMRGIAVGLALACGALCGYPAEEFVLVDDGRSACTIELTGDRQVDADIAFFTNGIVRMSGAELVVVPSCSGRVEAATSFLQLPL